MDRLQKLLSAAGVASRRRSEELILQGRVTVNGEVVTTLGTKADPTRDEIRVDGRRVKPASRLQYLLLNKPRGYVTTRHDPQGRRTVMELIPRGHDYLYPVGRLDYDSEGLLLLTNDGDLAAALTHPRHEVERVYRVEVAGTPDARSIERLSRGIVLDGQRTAPAKITVLFGETERAADAVLLITLHEGRNRQVRRMCEAVGHPVKRLTRIRIGPLTDKGLRVGQVRELRSAEVRALKKAVG